MRAALRRKGVLPAEALRTHPANRRVMVGGLVLFRQRPSTASGTIFVTLEDETGCCNLIIWPKIADRFRRAVFGGKQLGCTGQLQREGR